VLIPLALALAQDTGFATTGGTADTGLVDTAGVDPSPPPAYPRPVAYWPLDEVDSVAADMAHDHEGLLVGTSEADGPAGPALTFGPGAYGNLGDHLSRMTAGANQRFSLALWLRPDAAEPGVLWSKASHPSACGSPDTAGEFLVRTDGQGRVVAELFGGGGELLRVRSTGPVPLHAWSHLVIAQNGAATSPDDRVRLYLDGAPWAADVLVANGGPFDLPDTDVPLSLGAQLDLDGQLCSTPTFDGALDEAAVFNVALRADQVAAVHARSEAGASMLALHDPKDVLLLLDTSCSMSWGSPLSGAQGTDLAVETAASFVATNHGPEDMVAAITFADRPRIWTAPFRVADDPEQVLADWSTFDQVCCAANTNHAAALLAARQVLAAREDQGVFQTILLITDGNSTNGLAYRDEQIDLLRAAGIHVWAFSFGSSINDDAMTEYTQGFGTYEKTPDSSGIATVLLSALDAAP